MPTKETEWVKWECKGCVEYSEMVLLPLPASPNYRGGGVAVNGYFKIEFSLPIFRERCRRRGQRGKMECFTLTIST
jgi:hypothetical protein